MPCVPPVQKVHCVHRQHDGKVEVRLTLPLGQSQPKLATPPDDITEHLIHGELILTGENRDLLANLPSIAPQKRGCRLVVPISGRVAEDLQ
jgi:hypothetical protein